MQAAFRGDHGLQWGYCTPGMIMSAIDIVYRHSGKLDEATVHHELEGNTCRCTGYHNIVKSVLDAAGRTTAKLRYDRDMASARARRTLAGYESAPGLGCARLVQSLVGIGAKIAQAAAGRRSSNTATRQRRTRRVNNRKSFSFSSEAFAGMGITYRHQKEAQPKSQHDDVHMRCPLSRLFPTRPLRVPERKTAMDQDR
jgi:[2Fe-2S] binding domain